METKIPLPCSNCETDPKKEIKLNRLVHSELEIKATWK